MTPERFKEIHTLLENGQWTDTPSLKTWVKEAAHIAATIRQISEYNLVCRDLLRMIGSCQGYLRSREPLHA